MNPWRLVSFSRVVLAVVLTVGIVLLLAGPALAGGGFLDGGFGGGGGLFGFIGQIFRFLGLGLLRLIFFIPGGENFLINVL